MFSFVKKKKIVLFKNYVRTGKSIEFLETGREEGPESNYFRSTQFSFRVIRCLELDRVDSCTTL